MRAHGDQLSKMFNSEWQPGQKAKSEKHEKLAKDESDLFSLSFPEEFQPNLSKTKNNTNI